jgi:hypothetical protein
MDTGLLKDIGKIASIPIIILGSTTLLVRGCNKAYNNRTINAPSHHTVSYATGMLGHIEYTQYPNHNQEVKIYPGLGHRYVSSELHQDFNGDGLVDRIRIDGPEWKMNQLNDILDRTYDYAAHKQEFDNADKQLQELMKKYSTKK